MSEKKEQIELVTNSNVIDAVYIIMDYLLLSSGRSMLKGESEIWNSLAARCLEAVAKNYGERDK